MLALTKEELVLSALWCLYRLTVPFPDPARINCVCIRLRATTAAPRAMRHQNPSNAKRRRLRSKGEFLVRGFFRLAHQVSGLRPTRLPGTASKRAVSGCLIGLSPDLASPAWLFQKASSV